MVRGRGSEFPLPIPTPFRQTRIARAVSLKQTLLSGRFLLDPGTTNKTFPGHSDRLPSALPRRASTGMASGRRRGLQFDLSRRLGFFGDRTVLYQLIQNGHFLLNRLGFVRQHPGVDHGKIQSIENGSIQQKSVWIHVGIP